MKPQLKIYFILLLLPMLLNAQNISKTGFENYITAKGDQLFDGSTEFKFVSFNIPNLLFVEDPDWQFITDWEQEDALKTIAQLNGRVARTYTLSVKGGVNNSKGIQRSHVTGPGEFDEEVFIKMDKALQLANKYQVRLIIPFVDQWKWIGGIGEYAAFRGKKPEEFWTDSLVRKDFKKTVEFVLNRTNTFTGIKYKDDKSILCWETGNEIYQATDEWTNDIISYIKSIDKNHLVMCGKGDANDFSVNNPLIDIVTSHYYNYSDESPFAGRAKRDREKTKGKKPFVIGEFGCSWPDDMRLMTEEAVTNGTSGVLIWSLRFRNEKGGFYFHSDGQKPVTSRSYHWPGFLSNSDYYEPTMVQMLRKNAHLILGIPILPIPIPDAPVLLKVENGSLTWRGNTGSSSFIIERSKSEKGPWELVSTEVTDCLEFGPFFTDNSGKNNSEFYYRVKAQSESGISDPSKSMKNSLVEKK